MVCSENTLFPITATFQPHENKLGTCSGPFHESNFPIIVSFSNQSWGSGKEEKGSVIQQILHLRFPSQPRSLKPQFDNILATCMRMMQCLDTDDYSGR